MSVAGARRRAAGRIAALAAALLLAAPLPAAAAAGEGPRAALEAFLADLRTFQASFRQTVLDEAFRAVERSEGTIYLARPGRFRWEYRSPDRQIIVGDGKRVWFYDAELEQVTVRPFDEALGSTPALLLVSDRPLEEAFAIREVETRGGLAWVELRPRAADAGFLVIRVGLRDGALAAMELVDGFNQLTELRFARVRRNLELDPALFRFTPPPGTDLIEDR